MTIPSRYFRGDGSIYYDVYGFINMHTQKELMPFETKKDEIYKLVLRKAIDNDIKRIIFITFLKKIDKKEVPKEYLDNLNPVSSININDITPFNLNSNITLKYFFDYENMDSLKNYVSYCSNIKSFLFIMNTFFSDNVLYKSQPDKNKNYFVELYLEAFKKFGNYKHNKHSQYYKLINSALTKIIDKFEFENTKKIHKELFNSLNKL